MAHNVLFFIALAALALGLVSASDSRVRAVGGFFLQDRRSCPERVVTSHPRFGLIATNATHNNTQYWAGLNDAVAEMNINASAKVVYMIRHGQATHNLPTPSALSRLDPPLTALGVQQAATLSGRLAEEMAHGMKIDLVVSSPLSRALNTSTIVLFPEGQANSGLLSKAVPMVCAEECRETIGLFPCDKRVNTAELQERYHLFDFSMLSSDSDPLWTPRRESSDEEKDRARLFLRWVFSRSETHVAVFTHGGFTQSLLSVVGHRPYHLANSEVLPILLKKEPSHVQTHEHDVMVGFSDSRNVSSGFAVVVTLALVGSLVALAALMVWRRGLEQPWGVETRAGQAEVGDDEVHT